MKKGKTVQDGIEGGIGRKMKKVKKERRVWGKLKKRRVRRERGAEEKECRSC